VAKLFAYARFQLHVQQAQLQELQQRHDTTLHQQHYQCQVRLLQTCSLYSLSVAQQGAENAFITAGYVQACTQSQQSAC
jgi:hypothetical protein